MDSELKRLLPLWHTTKQSLFMEGRRTKEQGDVLSQQRKHLTMRPLYTGQHPNEGKISFEINHQNYSLVHISKHVIKTSKDGSAQYSGRGEQGAGKDLLALDDDGHNKVEHDLALQLSLIINVFIFFPFLKKSSSILYNH